MEAAHRLHLVDPDTGEISEHACPGCARREDEIKGLERDIRGWAHRFAELKRDKEAEAKANRLWPAAVELFETWKAACHHPGSQWDADRFFLVEPFLKRDGKEMCLRAIAGAAHDCFKVKRRNGSLRRFDEWDRIFKSRPQFEEFVNKAPSNWSELVAA